MFCFVFLNVYKPKLSDFLWASVAFSLYAILAITMAHVLQVNFTNLLESNIPFMEAFRVRFGQILYTILMYILGVGGVNLVLLVYRLVYNYKVKKKKISN